MTHPPCRGLFGRLLGHLFEAQFDSKPAFSFDRIHGCSAQEFAKVIEASKSRTYIGSVCKRCGATTDKSAEGVSA